MLISSQWMSLSKATEVPQEAIQAVPLHRYCPRMQHWTWEKLANSLSEAAGRACRWVCPKERYAHAIWKGRNADTAKERSSPDTTKIPTSFSSQTNHSEMWDLVILIWEVKRATKPRDGRHGERGGGHLAHLPSSQRRGQCQIEPVYKM